MLEQKQTVKGAEPSAQVSKFLAARAWRRAAGPVAEFGNARRGRAPYKSQCAGGCGDQDHECDQITRVCAPHPRMPALLFTGTHRGTMCPPGRPNAQRDGKSDRRLNGTGATCRSPRSLAPGYERGAARISRARSVSIPIWFTPHVLEIEHPTSPPHPPPPCAHLRWQVRACSAVAGSARCAASRRR